MPSTQITASAPSHLPQESILVVKREYLFPHDSWNGMQTENIQRYCNIVSAKKEFLPRHLAEEDPRYKQIIPYLIFKYTNELFVMQRRANASEKRLQSKYTIGIGGHIRQEDVKSNNIFDWANREFHEEVSYNEAMTIEPLGIINDDSNDVGKVHIGFVFLLHGHTNAIAIRSELKSGIMMHIDTCMALLPEFETWSQIALRHLVASSHLTL
jgi:predicted NUDIX family phosphoesterase